MVVVAWAARLGSSNHPRSRVALFPGGVWGKVPITSVELRITLWPVAVHMRATPVQLTRLADVMLKSSQEIGDAWRAAAGNLAVPREAYGDSAGAPGVHQAHELTVDDADLAIGRLVAVLEGDMDRLYRVAFAYQKNDEDAAARYRALHPGH